MPSTSIGSISLRGWTVLCCPPPQKDGPVRTCDRAVRFCTLTLEPKAYVVDDDDDSPPPTPTCLPYDNDRIREDNGRNRL